MQPNAGLMRLMGMDELVRQGRECRVCGESLRARMVNSVNRPDGHLMICRGCNRSGNTARMRGWRERNPGYNRAEYFVKQYNLTLDEWEAMFDSQDGACAICTRDFDRDNTAAIHVDHNHETGEVRGLLCQKCNLAIGYLQDDSAASRRAAVYLEDRS